MHLGSVSTPLINLQLESGLVDGHGFLSAFQLLTGFPLLYLLVLLWLSSSSYHLRLWYWKPMTVSEIVLPRSVVVYSE